MSTESRRFGEILLAHLREPSLASEGSAEDLDLLLARLLSAARQAWPGVAVSAEIFLAYLGARLGAAGAASIEQALGALRVSDLYLACACGLGDRAALAAFEKRYMADLDAAVRRVDREGLRQDDIKQVLRQKLFVGEASGRPKIAEYSGRGELRAWLRAVAVRAGIDAVRAEREVPVEGDLLDLLEVPGDHPEMAHLKQASGTELKAALRDALLALSDRERSLLQQYYLDGVNLEALASLYRVAPSTVSRSLAKARATLLGRVRSSLMTRMRLSGREVDSLVRLVRSQLELSQGALGRCSGG